MKTVIYSNITTGESFDSDGTLRTDNNPFSITFGEKRTIEWHLVTASPAASAPTSWTAVSSWEYTPSSGSVASDNNFRNAFAGTLTASVPADSASVPVTTEASAEEIAPTGRLRITRANGTILEVEYTARTAVTGGFTFSAEIPGTETALASGLPVDIMEEPLIRSGTYTADSTPASGIFCFQITANSWRIASLLKYSDTEQLETKGMELQISGLDSNSAEVNLIRVRVPFQINGVIDYLPGSPTASASVLAQYQTWTLALFASGTEIQYRDSAGTWSSTSDGANAFRWRISGISGMPWSDPVAIVRYAPSAQISYTFTVAEGNTDTEITIAYSSLSGVTGPFNCLVTQVQSDDSELDLSNDSGLQIFFTTTGIRFVRSTAFSAGTYRIRG